MLIIQSGTSVYGYDQSTGQFEQLELFYEEYPTAPTPDSLNECLEWLQSFLNRKNLPYTIAINEEMSKRPTPKTVIVYVNIMNGNVVKKESLALYTIANAITTGSTSTLETLLYEELK